MARETIETLGFGFPSFESQSRGTQQNRGPWIAFNPRVRALMTLPPAAKKRLAGLARSRYPLQGLGQDEYEILAGNYDVYDYAPSSGGGGAYSATGVPSGADYDTWLRSGDWGPDETRSTPQSYEGSGPDAAPGASSGSGWSWDSLAKGAAAVSQAVAQQRIIDLNIERAKKGLPLLDPRNFSPSAAVNFGLTPQASSMLLYGGIALAAVLLLRRKK